MMIGAKTVAFLLTVMLTTQFLVSTDFLLEQKEGRPCDKATIPEGSTGETFFRVEMIANPIDKPFFETSHVEEYRCSEQGRDLFPADFQSLLRSSYTPRLSTNMNMIVMGDSLGVQLAVLFQSVAADTLDSSNRMVLSRYPPDVGERDIYSLSKARGNGTIAEWRIFGLLRQAGLTQPLPPATGGGWRMDIVEQMKAFAWNNNTQPVGSFDIMLMRIPQVWITLEEATSEALLESILLASELYGVKTTILTNLPLIKDYTETSAVTEANSRIRAFVDVWHRSRDSLPVNVFLLEMGSLVNEAAEHNAQRLGYNTSISDYIARQIPNDPLMYTRPVATNCLVQPEVNQTTGTYTDVCPLNMLYFDGLHICMETFGPRIVAGVGCLVECAMGDPRIHRECEHACNQKYMRLNVSALW